MHEFGWSASDFDRLAGGSLAGHIIECGCQATGGLFTDWQSVPGWATIGYPIAECRADGSFTLTKPPGTGGLVARAPVAEQLLYEIGDPGAYALPDVICDFRGVTIEAEGEDRVRVAGARGLAPTDGYKVSATAMQGFRATGTLVIVGIDAAAKARRTAEAILERTRTAARRSRLRRLQRHPHRGARRRGLVRPARPRRRGARSDDAGRGRPRRSRRARDLRSRDRPGRHLLVARHHRPGRRPAERLAADPAARLHAAQERGRGQLHARRSPPSGGDRAAWRRLARCRHARRAAAVHAARRRRRRDDDLAADPPRLGAQRRQGQPVEHRRDRPTRRSGCRCSGTGSRRRGCATGSPT